MVTEKGTVKSYKLQFLLKKGALIGRKPSIKVHISYKYAKGKWLNKSES